MSPCSCRTGRASIGPPCPSIVTGLPGDQAVLGDDRRIFAAGRRHEAIAEAGVHRARCRFVQIDVDAPALAARTRAAGRRCRGCGRHARG